MISRLFWKLVLAFLSWCGRLGVKIVMGGALGNVVSKASQKVSRACEVPQ